jgi:hypothetical protein
MIIHQDEGLDRIAQGHLDVAKQTKPYFTATLSPSLQDDSSQLVQNFKDLKNTSL